MSITSKYLAPMRLLYISLICLVCFFTSCKNENKLPDFDIEELNKREYDSVKKLLSLSKIFIENKQYENSLVNLDKIINNYGTYEEVIEAQKLKDEVLIILLIKKIEEAKNIQMIVVLVEKVIDPEVLMLASDRVKDMLLNSKSIEEIEEYLNGTKFKEHEGLARRRLNQLKEDNKEEAYKNAVASSSSRIWKKFLEDYPDHPEKSNIETLIIELEVNEIFGGEYGDIPSSQFLGERNNVESSISIENDTRYTLTLRYSGPDIKKINIPPGETQKVNLKSGEYRVTASVNASNVRNFAGTESLYGEYSSAYYISSN
ncbi:hypothetical protein RXV94_09140 [Yeosuana sp. MJ-SS3]|uniref:Lipoprotein n=1 Tax=Gilvirhabdus luticola TaxID=3079858 RepID=A0ABU3U7E5_9FLAO|nr:hypothetical protein [Yeosuana sp. MJ-SS3]MDU8886323.1 hypothetical protein [Yeosuana sp. MJ-SS3]